MPSPARDTPCASGLIHDAGTPFGLPMPVGTRVWRLPSSAWPPPVAEAVLAFSLSPAPQVRFITPIQWDTHVDGTTPCTLGEVTGRFAQARAAVLAAPDGILGLGPWPSPLPHRRGWPLTYHDAAVVFAASSPFVRSGHAGPEDIFEADWCFKRDGSRVIFIEDQWAAAIADSPHAKESFETGDTLKHEWVESSLCWTWARQRFPSAPPHQLAGLALIFGGIAHLHTLRKVDSFVTGSASQQERAYNAWDKRELLKLGF